jgi:hypothetical protein
VVVGNDQEAGVAQGTFYKKIVRNCWINCCRKSEWTWWDSSASGPVRRMRRDRSSNGLALFFDFIREVPEFLRILNEAEFFAPIGYQKHLDNISTAYVRILRRARHAGAIEDFSDEEFEAIVHMFMGARGHLSRRYSYANGAVTAVPDHVISAYEKLITRGLFRPRAEDEQP